VKTRSLAPLASALALLAAPLAPYAATLSGVCPDGSFFVVQHRDAVPCANARFVDDPSELPPLRPHLLPRPYTWYVDQEARNPNNPYNLIDAAQKIRAARLGQKESPQAAQTPAPSGPPAPPQAARLPAVASAPPAALSLADGELRDLVRVIGLRQQVAPAELEVRDARGDGRLRIQLAHSSAFEAYALDALRRPAGSSRVLVFAALAEADIDFQPNFFVVQGGRTFRPDPSMAGEIGFLLGQPGKLPAGEIAVGYLIVPASFDPREAMELFWNDRSVDAVLAPEGEAPREPS
jgi:hypothetical protein